MEDFGNTMIRRFFTFAIMTLMLFAVLSGTAAAEDGDPATPTDLSCAHEHSKTTIYFYDSPAYTSIDAESHRVSGPAAVETVCLDCGELLSSVTVSNAEEIRPHSMKKDTCVLCGFHRKTQAEEKPVPNESDERTIIARKDEDDGDLLSLTLSKEELEELENADVSTVLIRGGSGSAAIALEVEDLLTYTESDDADLYTELVEREDGSFFARLYLVSGSGELTELKDAGITIRFYRENRSGTRVSVAPADSDQIMETRSIWDERGYWTVQYLEEGTYFLLQ